MTQPPARDPSAPGDGAPLALALRGISKRFGSLLANDSVDLEVRRGEVVALLGENGAGKTTLMNILFGHYTADSGDVRVAGPDGVLRDLPPGSPAAALAAGIGMVHQHFTLAENLSAFDNIVLGTEPSLRLRPRRRQARARLASLMEASGLVLDLDRRVDALGVGERQRVEILKALYRDARVLVLDEPTAVLTPQESDRLFATVRRLAGQGLAVILISHKLAEVLAVSHRIVVLRQGRNVGGMPTDEADRRAIASLMVGREVAPPRRSPHVVGAPVFALDRVDAEGEGRGGSLRGVSLAVRSGEIVGVAGVSGNGQAALAALAAGLGGPASGTLTLFGRKVRRTRPHDFVRSGVARIPEDRHREGIIGAMTVAENLVIERLDDAAFRRFGLMRRRAVRAHAEAAIRAYDMRCPGPDAPARLLSGGNIQKLVLARVLGRRPRFVLANQPTRGLDIGSQADVHRRLDEAAADGVGVLLISEDLDELLAVADRIVVMHAGRLIDAGSVGSIDRAGLGLMMAGHAPSAEARAA